MRSWRKVIVRGTEIVLLVVVLVWLYLFWAAGGPFWPFHRPRAEKAGTSQCLYGAADSVEMFREHKGRYPRTLEEVKSFLAADYVEDLRGYKGNDPQALKEVKSGLATGGANDSRIAYLSDGWGRPLKYVAVNPRLNVGAFDLYSLGENGIDEYDKPDFGDDILWQKDHVRFPPVKQK
jgi:hypothetical protein